MEHTEEKDKVIIAFINCSAGGGQGVKVFTDLKAILEIDGRKKVYDIKEDKGPGKGLEDWKDVPDLIVITGGGDGTVGWVLTVIDSMWENFPEDHRPQVVPLALGTANDMSRILKWGKGYSGESLENFIENVKKSKPIKLDRWKVILNKISVEEYKILLLTKSEEESKELEKSKKKGRTESKTETTIIKEDENSKKVKFTEKDIPYTEIIMKEDDIPDKGHGSSGTVKKGISTKPAKLPSNRTHKKHRSLSMDIAPPRPKVAAPEVRKRTLTTEATPPQLDIVELKIDVSIRTDPPPRPKSITPRRKENNIEVIIPEQKGEIQSPKSARSRIMPTSPKRDPPSEPFPKEIIEINTEENHPPPETQPPSAFVEAQPEITEKDNQAKFAKLEPKEQTKILLSNNYFSIGMDSEIMLDFDIIRTANPTSFPHRMVNFGVIGLIGMKTSIQVHKSLRHYCFLNIKEPGATEFRKVSLPKKAKVLVFCNVPSYSGGSNPWKRTRNENEVPEIQNQSINDGALEIFAMDSAAHILLTLGGLSRGGTRLGQAVSVELITLQEVAGQVDGEAYYLLPCKIIIEKVTNQSIVLFNTTKDISGTIFAKLDAEKGDNKGSGVEPV